jgi:Ca2+-binding RTX toxin-like protein
VIPAAVALAAGTVLATAPAAAADPVVVQTEAATITFSDDTLEPGQAFTVTIDLEYRFESESTGSSRDFQLEDNGNWVYTGCAFSGDFTGCEYTTRSRVTYDGAPVTGSATFEFVVPNDASGTIPYSGSIETDADDSDVPSTVYSGALAIDALGCTISGTSGNDNLTGTNGDDVICGFGGDDTIDGGNGSDIIYAGDGNDVVGGGNGADIIYGGAGNDANYGETLLGSLLYLFDNGDDTIYGGPGNDDLDGQNGDDTLLDQDGTDSMSGGFGGDNINVQDGVGGDTANGGLGTDVCTTDTGDTVSSC